MNTLPRRRHLIHRERAGGTCHVTWRLHRDQPTLSQEERGIILGILRRATEYGCAWYAAVVMDDHVHALFAPGASRTAARLVQAWKSTSLHLLVKRSQRTAPIWQAEYYLCWTNTVRAIDACAAYIRNNPRHKWPGIEDYPWILP